MSTERMSTHLPGCDKRGGNWICAEGCSASRPAAHYHPIDWRVVDGSCLACNVTAERTEREGLAAVIAEHAYDTGWRCMCGWTGSADEYDLHLADALADLLAARDRRVRAEALREAAEAIEAERASIEPKNHAAFAARLGMSNAARLIRDEADA